MEEWRSQRSIDAEKLKDEHNYHVERFEYWWQSYDRGEMTMEEAMQLVREERLGEVALGQVIDGKE